MNKELFEQQLSQLPLYSYAWIDPRQLEFNQRIRWICEHECPMYGKTWACPPGVGTVEHCAGKCRSFDNCLMIATITEVEDIADIQQTLATRPEHEEITNQVGAFMEEQVSNPTFSPQKPVPSASAAPLKMASPAAIRKKCTPAWKATESTSSPFWKSRVSASSMVKMW